MSHLPTRPPQGPMGLYRSPRGKMISGVCAGLAEKTGIHPWVWRAIFIIGTFTFGPGLIAYIVLAFLLPMDQS